MQISTISNFYSNIIMYGLCEEFLELFNGNRKKK